VVARYDESASITVTEADHDIALAELVRYIPSGSG
jgi:hypothetical protein